MKVAIIFAAIVIAALGQTTESPTIAPFTCDGNAFVCKLKEFGHHIKFHASNLGGKLKDVGTSVLTAATEQGKNLLVSGGQAVLGTILDHLNKSGVVGKRDLVFWEKLKAGASKGKEFLEKVKAGLKAAHEKAINKITEIMKANAALKVADDADAKIDEAVDDFKKEGKTGFAAIAAAVKEHLKNVFSKSMDKLKEKFAKKDTDKRALLTDIFSKAKEHFSNLAGGLKDAFQPHLDALTEGVKGLASKAKEHAGNLVDAAKTHFNQLKDKLSGHLDTLKGHASTLGGHAQNALAALKEAVTSIASQAAANIKDTVGDAVKTGSDAVNVVKDHVAGN